MTNSHENPNLSDAETGNHNPSSSETPVPPVPPRTPTLLHAFLFVGIAIIIAIAAIAGIQRIIVPQTPAVVPAETTTTTHKDAHTPSSSAPAEEGISFEEAERLGVTAADGDGQITGYQMTTTEQGVQFQVSVQNVSDVEENYEVVATGSRGAFSPVGETITLEAGEEGVVLVEVEQLPEATTDIVLSLNGNLLGVGLDEEAVSLTTP